MNTQDIAYRRLYQQRLIGKQSQNPIEVVDRLVAVQAQDYSGAKWALGLRMENATDALIEQACDEGAILRTHVMRPTWHFVTPTDIRWLLELTSPRVEVKLVYMDRQLEIDKALLHSSYTVITNALRDGKQLTRTELGSVLMQSNIVAEGLRLTHIVMHAELDALLCSGPRHGNQFTYMLLDERVPQTKTLSHDEALAELVRRYYNGHGPATIQDFAWWSGLTVADSKSGIAMLGTELTEETIDSQTYFYSTAVSSDIKTTPAAFLLPTYDEFFVGFANFDRSRRGGHAPSKVGVFDPPLLIAGQVVGSWKRHVNKGTVVVGIVPFIPLTGTDHEMIQTAVQGYSKFLGMPVLLLPY